MKRIVLAVASVMTLAGLPVVASAQLSGNVALTSNYKFRGQDQDVSKDKTCLLYTSPSPRD